MICALTCLTRLGLVCVLGCVLRRFIVMAFGLVSVAPHRFLQLSSARLVSVWVPGCCWA